MSFFGNSIILYYVILGLDPRISIRNSRILYNEIPRSSRDDTRLRNSRFALSFGLFSSDCLRLGNSRISSLRGSKATEAISRNSKFLSKILYYVILGLDPRISIRNSRILYDKIPRSSRGMTQGLGILDLVLGILDLRWRLGFAVATVKS